MREWLRLRNLLIAAAIFHLVVTAGICGLGHYQVIPGTIDVSGIALTVAPDGVKARQEAVQRCDELTHGHIRDWLNASSPFHIKLYSISFALLGLLFGSTVLSAELVNGLCYLAMLWLVFYLGREIFDRRAGLAAAAVVAVWPSLLLHTTQLLRDPLFVAGMLAFIAVNVRLLSRTLSWRKTLATVASGALMAALIWLTRDTMREVMIAIAALAGILFLVRQIAERGFRAESTIGPTGWRARMPALVGLALLIILSVGVTLVISKFHRPYPSDQNPAASGQRNAWQGSRRRKRDKLSEPQVAPAYPWSRFAARVGKLRRGFLIEFFDAGSNIDTDVQIDSTADLIRYLPRAAVIGFFAPFPRMWLSTGSQVSRSGRLLSGFEMLVLYLVEALAVFSLWSARRSLSVLFLWLVSATGMVSLGLVVVNVGALYRLRYVFVILLIILATEGAALTIKSGRRRLRNLQ